jgi:hypothetical protein
MHLDWIRLSDGAADWEKRPPAARSASRDPAGVSGLGRRPDSKADEQEQKVHCRLAGKPFPSYNIRLAKLPGQMIPLSPARRGRPMDSARPPFQLTQWKRPWSPQAFTRGRQSEDLAEAASAIPRRSGPSQLPSLSVRLIEPGVKPIHSLVRIGLREALPATVPDPSGPPKVSALLPVAKRSTARRWPETRWTPATRTNLT